MDNTRTEPSTITEEGLIERVAKALYAVDPDVRMMNAVRASLAWEETSEWNRAIHLRMATAALAASGHTALLSQIGVLREALEPFAEAWGRSERKPEHVLARELTFADYERARAALSRPLP